MLIPFFELVKKYNIQLRGVIHVGAHECEELPYYESMLHRNQVLWIEALPDKVAINQQRHANLLIENAIVSDVIENVTFHISNNGQSSSILEFGLHSYYHPTVKYINTFEGVTTTLQTILQKYTDISFNFINLDIQGAELKALQGLGDYLHNIDYIYTEVNSDYVYKNCGLINELDAYLSNYGFSRVETIWTPNKWGDAFYMKSSLLHK